MKKQTKLGLVLAAAAVISVSVASLVSARGWVQNGADWFYVDNDGEYVMLIKKLASTVSDDAAWRFNTYNPRSINMKDKVIATAEEIAKALVILLRNNNLIEGNDAYLEIYINEILK